MAWPEATPSLDNANYMSLGDLLDGVAENMEFTAGTYSDTAAAKEVMRWALDGLNFLLQEAPTDLLWSYAYMTGEDSADGAGTPVDDFTAITSAGIAVLSDSIRVIGLEFKAGDGGNPETFEYFWPKKVPEEKFNSIVRTYGSAGEAFEDGSHIWAESSGLVKLMRLEGSTNAVRIHYLRRPRWSVYTAVPVGGETRSYVETTTLADATHLRIPAGWDGLVIDYCTTMARMKDQLPARAEMVWQTFLEIVKSWFTQQPKRPGEVIGLRTESLSATDFLDLCAAKLDLVREDLSTSQARALQRWGVECLTWLQIIAPEHAVQGLVSNESALDLTDTQKRVAAFTDPCMKVIRVDLDSNSDVAKHIDAEHFDRIAQEYGSTGSSFGDGARIWSIVAGYPRIFRAGAGDEYSVDYLAYNASWPLTVPFGWSSLMATYAALKSRSRKSDPNQVVQFWKVFSMELSRLKEFEGVNFDVDKIKEAS